MDLNICQMHLFATVDKTFVLNGVDLTFSQRTPFLTINTWFLVLEHVQGSDCRVELSKDVGLG